MRARPLLYREGFWWPPEIWENGRRCLCGAVPEVHEESGHVSACRECVGGPYEPLP